MTLLLFINSYLLVLLILILLLFILFPMMARMTKIYAIGYNKIKSRNLLSAPVVVWGQTKK